MDPVTLLAAVLHSVWLLPVLVVLIALDGPIPMLPSEMLLMSAVAAASGAHDRAALLGLFLTALGGSVLGDLLVFRVGRSSHRLLERAASRGGSIGTWVRATVLDRPVLTLVGARFVPGGRLLSTAAAGGLGVPPRRFAVATVLSSSMWAGYMLTAGIALGPLVGGNPLLSVAAGLTMAAITGGGYTLVSRIRAARRRRTRAPALPGRAPAPATS